jgi:hypothetical protein
MVVLGELTMCRRIINMKMRLLDTFAMIALRIAQAKQPLLQEVILLVPEGKSHVLQAVSVTDTSDAVLAPSVCP